jgi:hypothetical protein
MTDPEETGAGDVVAVEVLERQKATAETETYKVGTLVLDLYDTKTKQLVLTGSSSDTLSNNSNKNIQNLDNGGGETIQQLPTVSSQRVSRSTRSGTLRLGPTRPCAASVFHRHFPLRGFSLSAEESACATGDFCEGGSRSHHSRREM